MDTRIDDILDKIIANFHQKRIYLEIIAEIIIYSDSFGSEKWGIKFSKNNKHIQFLIGSVIIASLEENCLWIVLDNNLLQSADKKLLGELETGWDNGEWSYYKSINTKNYYYRYNDKGIWEKIRYLHFEAIKNASNKYYSLKESSRKTISYELIDYLSSFLSINIPKPNNQIREIVKVEKQDYDEIVALERKMLELKPKDKLVLSRKIERGIIAQKIKKITNYECCFCKALRLNPHSFKKKNGVNYVETHHVIEVSYLQKGSLSISNLITLCANHHRQVHYGNVKLISDNDTNFEFKIDDEQIAVPKLKIKS